MCYANHDDGNNVNASSPPHYVCDLYMTLTAVDNCTTAY